MILKFILKRNSLLLLRLICPLNEFELFGCFRIITMCVINELAQFSCFRVITMCTINKFAHFWLFQAYNPVTNVSCIQPRGTQMSTNHVYTKIYFGWLYFLVMCAIPLLALIILNAFLVRAVRRSQKQRQEMMNVRQV